MGIEEKRIQGHPGRNLGGSIESGLRELPVRSTAAPMSPHCPRITATRLIDC